MVFIFFRMNCLKKCIYLKRGDLNNELKNVLYFVFEICSSYFLDVTQFKYLKKKVYSFFCLLYTFIQIYILLPIKFIGIFNFLAWDLCFLPFFNFFLFVFKFFSILFSWQLMKIMFSQLLELPMKVRSLFFFLFLYRCCLTFSRCHEKLRENCTRRRDNCR